MSLAADLMAILLDAADGLPLVEKKRMFGSSAGSTSRNRSTTTRDDPHELRRWVGRAYDLALLQPLPPMRKRRARRA